jgi:hypothetical protein
MRCSVSAGKRSRRAPAAIAPQRCPSTRAEHVVRLSEHHRCGGSNHLRLRLLRAHGWRNAPAKRQRHQCSDSAAGASQRDQLHEVEAGGLGPFRGQDPPTRSSNAATAATHSPVAGSAPTSPRPVSTTYASTPATSATCGPTGSLATWPASSPTREKIGTPRLCDPGLLTPSQCSPKAGSAPPPCDQGRTRSARR